MTKRGTETSDKINIIVERDGEFHKFEFGSEDNCKHCSLTFRNGSSFDACDVCMELEGHFKKVVIK